MNPSAFRAGPMESPPSFELPPYLNSALAHRVHNVHRCASASRHPPPLGRRLKPHSYLSVPGRVSLPYPPAGRAHSAGTSQNPSLEFRQCQPKLFFVIFCPSKIRSKTWTAQKLLLRVLFLIFGGPGVDFRRFWVPKQVRRAYFFGVFSKTVILLKSCSRCGGSTIFKV